MLTSVSTPPSDIALTATRRASQTASRPACSPGHLDRHHPAVPVAAGAGHLSPGNGMPGVGGESGVEDALDPGVTLKEACERHGVAVVAPYPEVKRLQAPQEKIRGKRVSAPAVVFQLRVDERDERLRSPRQHPPSRRYVRRGIWLHFRRRRRSRERKGSGSGCSQTCCRRR